MAQPIKVSELIAWLQARPPDAVVLYRAYSDFLPMELDDVGFLPKEGVPVAYEAKWPGELVGVIVHNEHWMLAPESWFDQPRIVPWVDAVLFPGN